MTGFGWRELSEGIVNLDHLVMVLSLVQSQLSETELAVRTHRSLLRSLSVDSKTSQCTQSPRLPQGQTSTSMEPSNNGNLLEWQFLTPKVKVWTELLSLCKVLFSPSPLLVECGTTPRMWFRGVLPLCGYSPPFSSLWLHKGTHH